jgi:hypothetical protein
MSHMSCINFIVMAVLPQLSHLSCLVPNALSFCHVLAILSSLSCPACTILTFSGCPGCPVLVVLPRLFCPSCPATAFLSPAVFPRCPLFVVMFSLPCPICLVLHILGNFRYFRKFSYENFRENTKAKIFVSTLSPAPAQTSELATICIKVHSVLQQTFSSKKKKICHRAKNCNHYFLSPCL